MAQKIIKNWEEIIREQQQSGKNIKAFCTAKGIHENTFYLNRKKLCKPGLVRIALQKEKTYSGAITVKYQGLTIIVEPESNRDTLKNILEVLGIIQ